MITTKQFPTLTGELQSIFTEESKAKIAEGVGLKLFGVIDTELRDYKHQLLHGIDGMSRLAEGQDFPLVSSAEGDNITYTQQHYGAMVAITKDIRKFWRTENGSIQNRVKLITDTAYDQIDQSMADVLAYGTSTSYTDVYGTAITTAVCPDGDALFSASHTTGNSATFSFSNIMVSGATTNPTLSRTAIVDTRVKASKFIDSNGVMRNHVLNTLVVPPELLDEAERIVYSNGFPRVTGTANTQNFAPNDINKTQMIANLNIVSWNRLSNPKHTNGATAWFLANDMCLKEACKAVFSQKPQMQAPEEVYENKNWEYTIDTYYTLGRGYPAGVYGSNGTGV